MDGFEAFALGTIEAHFHFVAFLLAIFDRSADFIELFSALFTRFSQLLRNEPTLCATAFVPAFAELDREADESTIVRRHIAEIESEILAGDPFLFGIAGCE